MQGWGALLGPEAPGDYYDGVVRKDEECDSPLSQWLAPNRDDDDASPARIVPLFPLTPISSPLPPTGAASTLFAPSNCLFSPKAKELNGREPPEGTCTSETENEKKLDVAFSSSPRFLTLRLLPLASPPPTTTTNHRSRRSLQATFDLKIQRDLVISDLPEDLIDYIFKIAELHKAEGTLTIKKKGEGER